MKDSQKLDLGSIQIHRQVIADIAANAITDVKGLALAHDGLAGKLQEFLGMRKYPAINVFVDKNNQLVIDVNVTIKYGLNISDVAGQAQDLIREAVERMGDLHLKDVNINVRGIERGDQ